MPRHHYAHSNAQKYISKRRVADRYGKNDRTITRWVANPELGFPQPVLINGRWYFEEAKLDDFDRRLAAVGLHVQARGHQAENKDAQCAGGEA